MVESAADENGVSKFGLRKSGEISSKLEEPRAPNSPNFSEYYPTPTPWIHWWYWTRSSSLGIFDLPGQFRLHTCSHSHTWGPGGSFT